jgi:hypothetical protein
MPGLSKHGTIYFEFKIVYNLNLEYIVNERFREVAMNVDELLAQLRTEWMSDMADLENKLRAEMDEKINKALEAKSEMHGHREYFPYTEWNKNVLILVKRFEQIEKHIELIERKLMNK